MLLYLASISENIEKIIKPNYRKKIILIDRFVDSTIAYQHYGMGIKKNLILNINSFLLGKIKPDIVFLNLVNKKKMFDKKKHGLFIMPKYRSIDINDLSEVKIVESLLKVK